MAPFSVVDPMHKKNEPKRAVPSSDRPISIGSGPSFLVIHHPDL